MATQIQRANEEVQHLALDPSLVMVDRLNNEQHHHIQPCNEMNAQNTHHVKPFHPQYPNEVVFQAALDLYNKQMEEMNENPSCSKSPQRWEYKGQIRASLQLCVLCKDIGKAKSFKEKYYLNVLEVKKYRSILCNGCLGYILCKHVGTCFD